jgi:hypothetical protein
MRIFATNLIDAAAVVQIQSSQDPAFPASNLRNPQRTKLWRTGTSAALEWSVFDLGSAQAVTACLILAHTLTGSDSLIKIQANTSDSWGAPAFEQSITFSAGVMSATFASQSYRFWRFTFTKASAGVTRDVGRLWLGTYYTPTDPPDFDGYLRRADDLSIRQRAPYGAIYGEVRSIFRKPQLDFSAIPNAQKAQFAAIAEAVKTIIPFFVQIDENAGADELAEPLYVTLRELPEFGVAGYDGENKWDTRLSLEEAL